MNFYKYKKYWREDELVSCLSATDKPLEVKQTKENSAKINYFSKPIYVETL